MSKKPAKKGKKRGEEESEAPPSRGWWRALFRWGWIAGAWLSTVILLIGLPVRMLGDDYDSLAVIFYATPWGVLMICGIVATIFWRRWWKVALGLGALALFCLGGWIWTGLRLPPEGRGQAAFRVAYWNCGHPDWRLRGILPMAAGWNADFLGFGETRRGALSPKWLAAFPGLTLRELGDEMLLAGPDGAQIKSSGSLYGGGEYHLCQTTLGGRTVFVLLVDFHAAPDKSRRRAFERLGQIVRGYSEQPLIVMGDFNTPAESVHMKALRGSLTDAFDNAGSGLTATWPMMLPVLSLDHILVNKHLRVVRCEHHTSIYSDHRAVVAELAWP